MRKKFFHSTDEGTIAILDSNKNRKKRNYFRFSSDSFISFELIIMLKAKTYII